MTGTASEPRIFFVVGSPRSGTTLLQSMLMQSPGVTIPPETHFMALAPDADLATNAGWSRLTEAVLARHRHEEIETPADEVEHALSSCERSRASALAAWLGAIAKHEGASIIGEKSPNHTQNAVELLAMFDSAKIVQIVRDPRDVALSQKEIWGRPTILAAKRWQLDMLVYERCATLVGSKRYLLVRYEDLVVDPEPAVRTLAGFLGLEFIPEMADPSNRAKAGFSSAEKHKLQTLEKVTTNRIGRYKGKLKGNDLAAVEAVCRPLMEKYGYTPEGSGGPFEKLSIVPQLPAALLMRRRKKTNVRHMIERVQQDQG